MRSRCAVGSLALVLLPTPFAHRLEQGADVADRMAVRTMGAAVPAVRSVIPEPLQGPLNVLEGRITRNSTLGGLLRDSLSPAAVHELVEASRPVYDLARISVGHPFGVTFGPDGLLAAFTYGIDELRTLRVTRREGRYEAEVVTRSYDVRVESVAGVITSSLFGAVEDSGEKDQLAVDLAEIFAWDVDFNTELQKGDTFRVAVEKLYLDGRHVGYSKIQAAELVRGERVIQAIRFEGKDGVGYYQADGRPLRKAFLRSPLKFRRISSGFTHARLHPILKVKRPHLGIDYAAPTGTPVRAAGDGVVTAAGWNGGFGKMIKIRHPNGYQTLYGHLSRIGVKVGQRVAQADVIGAVGSTGLSTAPHLDYRMIKDGSYINPLKLVSPPATPVPAAERAAFGLVRDQAIALLDRATTGSPTLTAANAP